MTIVPFFHHDPADQEELVHRLPLPLLRLQLKPDEQHHGGEAGGGGAHPCIQVGHHQDGQREEEKEGDGDVVVMILPSLCCYRS